MIKTYLSMRLYFTSLLNRDDRGATAVEYGLMVALIAAVIIGAVTLIGTDLNTMFRSVAGSL